MVSTYLNTKHIDSAFFNGVDLDKIFFNTVMVFQKSVELILPQAVTEINLQAFLDINASGSKAVTVVNNLIQPRIVTGDLTNYEVTFINNGEIQGTDVNPNAFHATTMITLLNNGRIRGAGGKGGNGGKGLDDIQLVPTSETKYVQGCGSGYSWADNHYSDWVTVTWANKWFNVNTTGTGPVTSDKEGLEGKFERSGSSHGNYTCQTTSAFYSVKRTIETPTARIGGAGGEGGAGQTFESPFSQGISGFPSTPTGGNSGGSGGAGGNWGVNGADGADGVLNPDSGEAGQLAGLAIVGTSFLEFDSNMGDIDGLTQVAP